MECHLDSFILFHIESGLLLKQFTIIFVQKTQRIEKCLFQRNVLKRLNMSVMYVLFFVS